MSTKIAVTCFHDFEASGANFLFHVGLLANAFLILKEYSVKILAELVYNNK